MSEITIPSKAEVETLTNAVATAQAALDTAMTGLTGAAKKGDMAAIEAAVFAKKDADSALVRAKNALARATDLVANAGRMRVNVAAHDAIRAWFADSAEVLESVGMGTTGFRITATKGDNGNVTYQVNVTPEVGSITRAPRESNGSGGRGKTAMRRVVGHGTDVTVGSKDFLLQFGGQDGADAVAKAAGPKQVSKTGQTYVYNFQGDIKKVERELAKAGYTVTMV